MAEEHWLRHVSGFSPCGTACHDEHLPGLGRHRRATYAKVASRLDLVGIGREPLEPHHLLDYDRVVPKTCMENLPIGSSGRYVPSMARSAGPLLGLDPDRLRNLTPSLSPTVPRLTVITPKEQQ